jgi:hypothetical protein
MALLSGIDTIPSAKDFQSVSLDPTAALFLVAGDAELHIYLRRRAVSLMSLFKSPESAAALLFVATSGGPMRLRWIAVYTYCRGWADAAPTRVLTFAQVVLDEKEPLLREAAIRGLAYLSSSAADAILNQQQRIEKDRRVLAAIRRVKQRRNRAGLPLR